MIDKDGVSGEPGSSTQSEAIVRGVSLTGDNAASNETDQQQGSAKSVDGKDGSIEVDGAAVEPPIGSLDQISFVPMLDDAPIETNRTQTNADDKNRANLKRDPAGFNSTKASKESGKRSSASKGQQNNHHASNLRSTGSRQVVKYAALDLGTNNCRLLIAEPKDQGFRIVDSFSRIVRLGEGISSNNRLGDDASDRAISALRICWNKLKYHKVEKVRLIATEACRSAENGAEFLQRVTDEIGLELEIIDRETEARLAMAGCSSLVEPRSDGVVLFDIGGGSSEIVWMDRRGRRKRNRLGGTLRAWDSLPVGVVTLSERHDGKNVSHQSFENMVNEVRDMLTRFPKQKELRQALSRGRHHLLGTSGTVTTLAGVHLGLRRYDRRRVDGMWMSNDEAARMIDKLLNLSYDDRVKHPCIGPDRADLVLPGCAIFEAIRQEFQCDQLRVADRGLREGILVELMGKDGHGRSKPRNRSTPWRRKRPKSGTKQGAPKQQGNGPDEQ
ncbi:MAG: Ppx/GppA phosphatase family protein [Hyphomicrobiales bacterium]